MYYHKSAVLCHFKIGGFVSHPKNATLKIGRFLPFFRSKIHPEEKNKTFSEASRQVFLHSTNKSDANQKTKYHKMKLLNFPAFFTRRMKPQGRQNVKGISNTIEKQENSPKWKLFFALNVLGLK